MKRILLTFIVVSAISIALSLYFKKYISPQALFSNKKLYFALLEVEGNIYRFPSALHMEKALLIFLPDTLGKEFREGFKELLKRKKEATVRNVEILLLSSIDGDNMYALKAATNYEGKILLDSAASALRYFTDWYAAGRTKKWRMALVDKEGKVLWKEESKKPTFPW